MSSGYITLTREGRRRRGKPIRERRNQKDLIYLIFSSKSLQLSGGESKTRPFSNHCCLCPFQAKTDHCSKDVLKQPSSYIVLVLTCIMHTCTTMLLIILYTVLDIILSRYAIIPEKAWLTMF